MVQAIGTILVPIDGSPESEAALPMASRLAEDAHAAIVLLHVTQLPESGRQGADAAAEANETLDRVRRKLAGDVRTRVEETGDPARGIIQTIEDEHADMVVMATHGRTGLASFTNGSIAHEVVTAGKAPVTLVHRPDD